MKKFLNKIISYFQSNTEVKGEEMTKGFKTINPKENFQMSFNAMTHGDRKRYFTNYNEKLLNRISEIKSQKS